MAAGDGDGRSSPLEQLSNFVPPNILYHPTWMWYCIVYKLLCPVVPSWCCGHLWVLFGSGVTHTAQLDCQVHSRGSPVTPLPLVLVGFWSCSSRGSPVTPLPLVLVGSWSSSSLHIVAHWPPALSAKAGFQVVQDKGCLPQSLCSPVTLVNSFSNLRVV